MISQYAHCAFIRASAVGWLACICLTSAAGCATPARPSASSSSERPLPTASAAERTASTPESRDDENTIGSSASDAGASSARFTAPFPLDFNKNAFGPDSGIGPTDPNSQGHLNGFRMGALEAPEYPLVIRLKAPYGTTAKKLALTTRLRFFGKPSSGSLTTFVSAHQLKEIFGVNFRQWTDKNAGNCIGADAHHFAIEDKRLLKPQFEKLISDMDLNDDPKRELFDDGPEYTPE